MGKRTMKKGKSNKGALDGLARIAPIVRGLLAAATGDEDIRYCSVILQSFTDPQAIEFASSPLNAAGGERPVAVKDKDNPPLFVDPVGMEKGEDALREQLKSAVDAHQSQNGSAPETICLKGLGILNVAVSMQWNPKRPLEGKIALVTGAAGAIGYGVCRALLENGCYLVVSDLAGKKLDGFVKDMEKISSSRVIAAAIDVTDKDSVAEGFNRAALRWGGIDIVVHNAGIAHVSTIKEMDLDAFCKLEKVNVEGTLLTLREAGRLLISQGIGGDVVIMSTKNVPSPSAGFGAYSATKAACHQLGRIASLELAPHDIRVNMVAPDAVFAEGKYKSALWAEVGADRMKVRGLDEKALHEYYRERNLLKAKVTARHVANAVLFFATRRTPTTGATIPVDGGLPDATPR
ncbi:MAG: SDR family oxidoreductase [Planctomycetota bacterium]|jgi:NAD(P)-dependent dehydrogenase (short-subunit alcohol dehydrogenase family)